MTGWGDKNDLLAQSVWWWYIISNKRNMNNNNNNKKNTYYYFFPVFTVEETNVRSSRLFTTSSRCSQLSSYEEHGRYGVDDLEEKIKWNVSLLIDSVICG